MDPTDFSHLPDEFRRGGGPKREGREAVPSEGAQAPLIEEPVPDLRGGGSAWGKVVKGTLLGGLVTVLLLAVAIFGLLAFFLVGLGTGAMNWPFG